MLIFPGMLVCHMKVLALVLKSEEILLHLIVCLSRRYDIPVFHYSLNYLPWDCSLDAELMTSMNYTELFKYPFFFLTDNRKKKTFAIYIYIYVL